LCNQKEGENKSTKRSYRSILVDIWNLTPIQKILQPTTFNLKLNVTNENVEKAYKWTDDIYI